MEIPAHRLPPVSSSSGSGLPQQSADWGLEAQWEALKGAVERLIRLCRKLTTQNALLVHRIRQHYAGVDFSVAPGWVPAAGGPSPNISGTVEGEQAKLAVLSEALQNLTFYSNVLANQNLHLKEHLQGLLEKNPCGRKH